MGQYYRFIFLSEFGEIIHWIDSYDFHCSKMMEFAWLDLDNNHNSLVEAVEGFIAGPATIGGNFHGETKKRYRLVCAGDYGAPELKAEGSVWTERKRDLATVLEAVKAAGRYCFDGIDYKDAKSFLERSPLDYGGEDRTFVEKCLNAWYKSNMDKNLYHMCNDLPDRKIKPATVSSKWYPYIVNHTRKEFVDKRKNSEYDKKEYDGDDNDEYKRPTMIEHPLPLLVCETASGGGGDYRGMNESDVGGWARDVITMESERPGEDYKEFVVGFREC